MKTKPNDKCRGCGGTILNDEDAVKIINGKLEKNKIKYASKDTWGYMHRGCFLVAVGDPQAIFHIRPTKVA